MIRRTSQGAKIVLAGLILSSQLIFAQETLLEKLSEQEAENTSDAENYMQELLSHPLEVNRLSREDLLYLPFLTSEQINGFFIYRQKHGEYNHLDEALAALAVSGDTLALCREIFFLSSPSRFDLHQLSVRWRITRPATVEDNWLGAPYRSYERAMISTAALSIGVLAERDPGEKHFDDHGLFYGQWQSGNDGKEWKIIAGNYQIEWAQGLALWSPYGTTVSADVHGASRREGRGLLPYISGNENAALRGGAVVWNRQQISLSAFASSQQLDVTLRDNMAVRLDDSGYHRTSTELARRNTQQEQLFGAAMKFSWRNKIAAGVLGYRSQYDKNWIRSDLASGHFDFSGRANDVLSLSLAATTAGWQTNIEAARSSSGGAAGSVVLSGEAPRLRWTAEGHYYDRDFHSLHGQGFNTIANLPQNEFGYSLGLSSRLRRGLLAEVFLSKRQDLWRTSTLPLPGAQLTAGAGLEWKIRRDLILQGRWQQTRGDELMPRMVAPFTEREIISPQSRHSGRLKLEYQISPQLRSTSRLDFAKKASEIGQAKELGLALSQETQWRFRNRLLVTGRYAIFDAPANAPIYQYEHDLPGVFTNFALREQGRRAYIYVRYLSTFGFDLSCKIVYTERERSLFERIRSWAWGAQIDWRLSSGRP
jgi:hypothetical protein